MELRRFFITVLAQFLGSVVLWCVIAFLPSPNDGVCFLIALLIATRTADEYTSDWDSRLPPTPFAVVTGLPDLLIVGALWLIDFAAKTELLVRHDACMHATDRRMGYALGVMQALSATAVFGALILSYHAFCR